MNTTNLIKNHSQIYHEFYLKHFLVISSPFIMNWSDDVYPGFSGVSIKQKIPLRLYLGLEKNSGKKIEFGKINYRDPNRKGFSESVILEYAPYFYDMEDMLNKMYADLIKEYGGITINILSDSPRARGLGFEAVLSMVLSFLMNRLLGNIDANKLEKINKLEINEALYNNHIGINKILADSFSIDLKIFGRTFYSRKVSSLFAGGYPVVSFSENNYVFNSSDVDLGFKRFAFRLNELFPDLRSIPYSPLDYGLIYTGKPMLMEQVIDKNITNVETFRTIKKELEPKFKPYFQRLLPINKPRFYADLLDEQSDVVNNIYGKMMGVVSLEILHFMRKIFSEGYNEGDMKDLLKAMEKIRYGNYISRENSETMLFLINKMMGSFNANRNLISLFPNDTSIMGGTLGFVMPTEGFRSVLTDAIDKIKTDFIGTDLFYCNRLDGIEHEGLRIEQDIDQGMYSPLLGDNIFLVTDLSGKRLIGSHEGLLKRINNGLLLDNVHSKIYFDGVKLTSDDIHSQTATIEILSVLVDNLGKDVSNSLLPASRYSKNKNDMIGKIVIPLIDFIEKKTQKRLPLICKGSLYDFYMKINNSNIPIYFLKKL